MKIEEFSKYKSLVESRDFSEIENHPDAERIYSWMEETGRLDEGILQSVWSWLKKHFSIRSKRLHDLADEYEKEVMAEGRAEWERTKNKMDLAAKYRAGSYTKLSRDIEERMEIIAGDDDDYRDLVRKLINKKNMKAKRDLLKLLAGKMEPDDPNLARIKQDIKEFDEKYQEAREDCDKFLRSLSKPQQDVLTETLKLMERKIRNEERTYYNLLELDSEKERREYVENLFYYVNNLSHIDNTVECNAKSVYSMSKKYVDLVKELVKKMERDDVDEEDAIKAIIKSLNIEIMKRKPLPFSKIKDIVYKNAKNFIEGKGHHSFRNDIEGEDTDDLMSDEEKEEAIDAAKNASGKAHPSGKTLKSVIEKAVKDKFASDSQIKAYVEDINSYVEEFNNLTTVERKKKAKEYDYDILPDFKLKNVNTEDVKDLLTSFIDIVGIIYPYFENEENDDAIDFVEKFLLEIHGIKKDASKKLVEKERDKLIENMKKKYPDQFK